MNMLVGSLTFLPLFTRGVVVPMWGVLVVLIGYSVAPLAGLKRTFGMQLMDAVETSFFKSGITTVRLEVRTSNDGAQRLYAKLGYGIVRRMPHYYTSGDDGYLMVKNL